MHLFSDARSEQAAFAGRRCLAVVFVAVDSLREGSDADDEETRTGTRQSLQSTGYAALMLEREREREREREKKVHSQLHRILANVPGAGFFNARSASAMDHNAVSNIRRPMVAGAYSTP